MWHDMQIYGFRDFSTFFVKACVYVDKINPFLFPKAFPCFLDFFVTFHLSKIYQFQ